MNPADKVVILKVKGKLSEGKTTDIDFADITDSLLKSDAREVKISRNQLTSAEYEIIESKGDTADEIATNTFEENIGQVDSALDELVGQKGVQLAKRLLADLSLPPHDNEPLNIYQDRIVEGAMATLGLVDEDDRGNKK